MMKLVKKKKKPSSSSSSSSSSSHAQLISHVFPLSWFSKTRKKPAPKTTQKPQLKSPKTIPKSPISDSKFYTQDNDGFWRLSFGDNDTDHRNLTTSSQRYCGSCKSNVRKLREDRRIIEATSKLGGELSSKMTDTPSKTSEWEKLKEEKIREFHSKSEKQRKSVHISRQCKIKVQSPRTPNSKTESCKIKALEDLKRKKIVKMKEMDSYAVVKSSKDPQQDFRESMLEMIMEKRIRKPEELEELLACYLTLNADEYHDLIIKVFRQVWFELDES